MDANTMIIYHYDPATGELLHSGPVYIGPEGDQQIPAFATVTPPPELTDGYAAAVVPGSPAEDHSCAWSLVRDWRETQLFRTADGAAYVIGEPGFAGWNGFGDLPGGLTDVPRPTECHAWSDGAWVFDLGLAKVARLAAIEAECAERQVSPFEVAGHQFDADPVSAARILAAGQMGGIAKAAGRAYTSLVLTSTGAEIELDADGLVDLALALGEHQDSCRRTVKQLKDAIAAAETEAGLSAISWP